MQRKHVIMADLLWICGVVAISISSCSRQDTHRHIPTSKASELGELVQPTNQTVYSDINTIVPVIQSITPLIQATGVISYDPRLLHTISARFGGRVEKLYVRYNFHPVIKGQRIMDIYSPEIVTAQQNLVFLLLEAGQDAALIQSAKAQLQLLGLTSDQLRQIESTKQIINPLPLYSPYTGHIHDIGTAVESNSITPTSNSGMGSSMNRPASSSSMVQIENLPSSSTSALTLKEGMYVQNGEALFAVYNTNQVWAVLNIFPKDASLIHTGADVSISAETNPDKIINAKINFIEPVAGQNASAIKARVYLSNAENLYLKIGTILSAKIIPAEIKGMWLPRKSVIDLGQRQIVFVKRDAHFIAHPIKTGIVTDSLIQILSGLTLEDEIAQNAQFLVDSESFIQTNYNGQQE